MTHPSANSDRRKRILILTSSTGGGHNMRAAALQAWAEKENDLQLDVVIHQTLESTHPLYAFGVELYNFIQRTAPILHHIYFNWLEWIPLFRCDWLLLNRQGFIQILEQENPDLIVSTHAHVNHAFFTIAKNHALPGKLPCVTYCGELFGGYGFSCHWVNPKADLFIGAVSEVCTVAQKHGMPAEKTLEGGFLLRPTFWDEPPSASQKEKILREEFGFDPGVFTLLLSTGAQGANNHLPLLESIAQTGEKLQVITLCGKNTDLIGQITEWSQSHPQLRVIPLPYRENMDELLYIVSAVVARPGTGSTSEAILTGCPLILNGIGGIMPQERITVKYCRQHGINEILRRPTDLSRILRNWISKPKTYEQHQLNMIAARPKGHPRKILETLRLLAA